MSEHQLEHPSENGLVEGGEEAGPIVSASEQPGPIGAGEAEPTGAGEGELGGSEEWEIELVRADGKESEDLTGGSREVDPRADFLLGENESNGGESERASSMAWSEINFPGESKRERRNNSFGGTRRKKALVEDDWEDWPILGSGWKRKEVFRRSGASVGKTDTYYLRGCENCGKPLSGMEFGITGQLCSNCSPAIKPESPQNIVFRKFPIPQYLNPEDFSYFYVDNEDDNDDQDGPKKRSRRSCGGCEACLRTTDCRTCDFCQDKPKFGGRNKKRQKCRLRQCQVEAMRHLLPFQRGQTKHMGDVGWLGPGRQRPQSPRTSKLRRSKAGRPRKKPSPDWPSWGAFQFTNNDDEEEEEEYELQGDPLPQLPQYPGYPNHKPEPQQLNMSGYPVAMQEVQVLYDRTGAPVLFEKPPPQPSPVVPQMLYSKATAPPFCREVQQQGEREVIETIDLEEEEEEEEGVKIIQVDTGDDDVLEVTPVITGIYSLASGESAQPQPHKLLLFLDRIRQVPLPAHWVGLALEGPRIQLLQCSKLSTMSDTVVQIEPGFYYQITVQGQPLLLSHPLYERHPQRLLAVGDVIGLLADLEGYRVCPGYPSHLPAAEGEGEGEPVMFVRAAACDLLVRSEGRCDRCSVTPLVV
ncbi:UNVERIFIED_CONTAM: hypothetical protein FKN15_073797 [Acipenser sinensis]